MLAITKNTEKILLDDLRRGFETKPEEHCFYIAFSKIKIEHDFWYPIVVEKIQQLEKDKDAKIYICHDRDIFILLEGLRPLAFETFVNDLAKQLKFEALSNFIGVFPLKDEWPKLEIICKKKIRAYQEAQKRAQDKKLERNKKSIVELDANLVKSLKSRRSKRQSKDVMVVDDDQLSRTLINNVLAKDYAVHFSVDGNTAIREYVLKAPDVLFLDIGLPDMTGHDVLSSIFQVDPDAYVVMFSGRKDESNVMKAIDMGAKGYVIKPFSKDKIMGYIQKSPFIQEKQHAT